MEENNCIPICFPMGSGGHIAGRLLASCDNVSWYDHEKNGEYPWLRYRIGDDYNFSQLHFNKRFKGANGKGICSLTVPPVLDVADRQKISYNKLPIIEWKQKIFPNNLIYTLSSKLDSAKDFFTPAKFFVIIPENIELLLDRWFATTGYYYVDPKNKNYTFKDLYDDKAKNLNTDARSLLRYDMQELISNYKSNIDEKDVVISEVEQMYDRDYFKTICDKFDLIYNKINHKKTVDLAIKISHL